MMEFLENPIWLGGGGLLLAGATFMGWVQTGHKAALWGAIVIAVLTIVGVVILMRIETEKEKIETMLHHMAHDLETNNFDRLIARIHPQATETVARAKGEIKRYQFSMAKITRIRAIDVDEKSAPARASVEMNVVVEGSFGGFSGKAPRYVELKLMKQGENWMVFDFDHQEPMAGFR